MTSLHDSYYIYIFIQVVSYRIKIITETIVQSTFYKSYFSLQGQPKFKREKTNFPLFFVTKYLGALRWNLSELNLFFNLWIVTSCGNQNTQRKHTFNFQCQNNNPLNYNCYCEKSMAFPQRWRSRDMCMTFVMCELVYIWRKNTTSITYKDTLANCTPIGKNKVSALMALQFSQARLITYSSASLLIAV